MAVYNKFHQQMVKVLGEALLVFIIYRCIHHDSTANWSIMQEKEPDHVEAAAILLCSTCAGNKAPGVTVIVIIVVGTIVITIINIFPVHLPNRLHRFHICSFLKVKTKLLFV